MLLPELVDIMKVFKDEIKERKDKQFFGTVTTNFMKSLDLDVADSLKSDFLVSSPNIFSKLNSYNLGILRYNQ